MRISYWLTMLVCTLAGCAGTLAASTYVSDVPGLSADRLLTAGDEPVLFLGPERDAPAVGYAAKDLVVRIVGPAKGARTPVQIDGPLEVRGYVPNELLSLRVQRRGRLRDTSIYLGPNDRVRVLGPASEPGRVRVAAAPLIIGYGSTVYEGTYPVQGLATKPAPKSAQPPEPGAPHQLAAGLPFSLFDAPDGKLVFSPKASPLALDLTVLRKEGSWYAVRVGTGPYLIGYTNAPLTPQKQALGSIARPREGSKVDRVEGAVPARLMQERGALKRVVAGTALLFNNAPIAVLHQDAWAM